MSSNTRRRSLSFLLPLPFLFFLFAAMRRHVNHMGKQRDDDGRSNNEQAFYNMSTSFSSELLKWSHATNSIEELNAALENDEITAIECDIMMGHEDNSSATVPILSHPPIRHSDLTLSHFLSLVSSIGSDGRLILQKHIKLDFKEISALKPSLNQIFELHLTNPVSKIIFLNADILPGPGRRSEEHIDPSPFLETSLSHIRSDKDGGLNYALSLGYKVNFGSGTGYTKDDIDCMTELVRQYKLEGKDPGLVLALNARVLSKDNTAFDGFLETFGNAQILAWTGSGEPGIPKKLVTSIVEHYRSLGMLERIGFDCEYEE